MNFSNYFWRARTFDGSEYSEWTKPRTFSINGQNVYSFNYSGNQLSLLKLENVYYSDSLNSLTLNKELLPPKPVKERILDTINVHVPIDNFAITTITTDGTFIYYGNMAWFNQQKPSPIFKIGKKKEGDFLDEVIIETYKVLIKEYYPKDRVVMSTFETEMRYAGPKEAVFHAIIRNQIFYHQGYIYVAIGDPYRLIKVDPLTGDSSSVQIPSGMLFHNTGTVTEGANFLSSDGKNVYNFAFKDSASGLSNYVIRIFDPSNNWERVGEDIVTSSTSYVSNSGQFVADGYYYPFENLVSGYMKKIRISDGYFVEEWITVTPFPRYFSWCYDSEHDVVYASIVDANLPHDIHKFAGRYREDFGAITSSFVGPASQWNKLDFNIEAQGFGGEYQTSLFGMNKITREIDLLASDFEPNFDISNIDAEAYNTLQFAINIEDTSIGIGDPFLLKSLTFDYISVPEIVITPLDISFNPDTLLQGFSTNVEFKAINIGYSSADSAIFNLYLNDSENSFGSFTTNILPDSVITFQKALNTSPILFDNQVKVKSFYPNTEMFTFNNIASNSFYVARDSVSPDFFITFDGIELVSGDIVSPNPEVKISLKDNSPLPLDTTNFFIYLDNNPLSFSHDSLNFAYTPYPNSEAVITWKPSFTNGNYILEVLAKDASGNYFDTTSYRVAFSVNTTNNILDIYNYPNPFADDTYFTFTLTGSELPQEFKIKIYTVAGRLIRVVDVPQSDLNYGFNKIYWNGRDEDGNNIANGVYFYKITLLNNGEYRSEIKKLAKVK